MIFASRCYTEHPQAHAKQLGLGFASGSGSLASRARDALSFLPTPTVEPLAPPGQPSCPPQKEMKTPCLLAAQRPKLYEKRSSRAILKLCTHQAHHMRPLLLQLLRPKPICGLLQGQPPEKSCPCNYGRFRVDFEAKDQPLTSKNGFEEL